MFTTDNAVQLTINEHDPEHNVAEFLAQVRNDTLFAFFFYHKYVLDRFNSFINR